MENNIPAALILEDDFDLHRGASKPDRFHQENDAIPCDLPTGFKLLLVLAVDAVIDFIHIAYK